MSSQQTPNEQELAAQFRRTQTELQSLVQKITELERELEEHVLVGATLKEAYESEPDRKCFRLVGGVLVERTVKEVLPQLEGQTEQLKGILETLMNEHKKKERNFAQWQKDNKIVIKQRQ
ncbi:tubulin-binding prefolding complex subunit GIM4 [Sporobolomyces salmoneus]|uniref:tubulin-binding prefolding complex subunit GIM4 n=1 Tax=Sporobolomyces salmoneus TaxID=183962 RepID=UPI00317797B5